ncbi:kinase-like domain-containing protein [Cladochytrium replicatum]|nr:kinase-like domain-containing protein [Cladochytrium replicatum]
MSYEATQPTEASLEDTTECEWWGRLVPLVISPTDFTPDAILLTDDSDSFTIGRQADKCDFVVDGSFISNQHCRIFQVTGSNPLVLMVEDLSFNGTFVNTRKLGKGYKTVLAHGDEICFGVHGKSDSSKVYLFQRPVSAYEDKTPATEFFKQYDLRQELGRGQFSIVRMGVRKQDGQMCAVKVIEKRRFWMNSKVADALDREVKILKKLDHPHIVQFIDFHDEGDTLYIVMELVRGGDMLKYINDQGGRVGEGEARRLFKQIVESLKYLRSQSITHRDLKPENYLVTEDHQLKLADFGVAKGMDAANLNTMCGTPIYLAPEVIEQKFSYDSRVDLYSAGVILFYMLSGRAPFEGKTEMEVFEKIKRGQIDWSMPVWKTMSETGIDLVRQLIRPNPNDRIPLSQIEKHPWMLSQTHLPPPVPRSATADVKLMPPPGPLSVTPWAYLIEHQCSDNIIAVTKHRIVIGRAQGVDIQITDQRISNKHCVIMKERDEITITDHSTNSIMINGETLGKNNTRMLRDGDMIGLVSSTVAIDNAMVYTFRLSNKRPGTDLQEQPLVRPVKRHTSAILGVEGSKRTWFLRSINPATVKHVKFSELHAHAVTDVECLTLPVPIKTQTKFTIGRSPSSNVVISHSIISSVHCTIGFPPGADPSKGNPVIVDLSTNGTFVNGSRITKSQPFEIQKGAEIMLGADNTEDWDGTVGGPVGFRLEIV